MIWRGPVRGEHPIPCIRQMVPPIKSLSPDQFGQYSIIVNTGLGESLKIGGTLGYDVD